MSYAWRGVGEDAPQCPEGRDLLTYEDSYQCICPITKEKLWCKLDSTTYWDEGDCKCKEIATAIYQYLNPPTAKGGALQSVADKYAPKGPPEPTQMIPIEPEGGEPVAYTPPPGGGGTTTGPKTGTTTTATTGTTKAASNSSGAAVAATSEGTPAGSSGSGVTAASVTGGGLEPHVLDKYAPYLIGGGVAVLALSAWFAWKE